MKTCLTLACAVAAATAVVPTTALALTVDYANKGTDGALVITANRTIDLSQSATRAWDAAPEARGSGVYDPEKWAVVFKYSSVDIGPNATVTFNNHASRAPVVWLVDGDVTIHGTVNLNGQDGDTNPSEFRLSEPGAGGFRGGERWVSPEQPGAAGFGPGGTFTYHGSSPYFYEHPSHATLGWSSQRPPIPTYGNSRVIPLLGGSGGGGYLWNKGGDGGGAGGGAILIVVRGTILIAGRILANGGDGNLGGSGGSIRLVGGVISGGGRLEAVGHSSAGEGRIRLEADNFQARFTAMLPITQAVRPDSPVMIWPPAEAPTARVVSVSGVAAPNDPRSSLGPPSNLPADVTLENGPGSGEILIETDNLPRTASVMLRLSPRYGAAQEVRAEFLEDTAVPNRFRWRVQKPLNLGYVALQVRATAQ